MPQYCESCNKFHYQCVCDAEKKDIVAGQKMQAISAILNIDNMKDTEKINIIKIIIK
jgi:hypothetical protein